MPAFTDIQLDLPDERRGKVRVSYALPGNRRLFITTDRLSAFDHIIAGVPYKGQVLNQLAAWWFEQTCDIVPNHVLSTPDPNVTVARAATPLAVEVVVRGYITGVTSTSLWQQYADGARTIYGYEFPDGLQKNSALPAAIITPTTKAADGAHDEPITCDEVVSRGIVDAEVWQRVQHAALALFARGQQIAAAAGLILADTKYEFGVTDVGELLLIDEMHTPDSSRIWVAATYAERVALGEDPESLDKEPIRAALAAAGYRGDGPIPQLGDAVWQQTSQRYQNAYTLLTGRAFEPGDTPVAARVARRVAELTDDDRKPREECGVLGISTPHGDHVAQLAFFGLYALQHRGQEAAGIAVSDGHRARIHKSAGLVSRVFDQAALAPLVGYHAIGHTRYSTTGGSNDRNIQPFMVETMHGPLAVAHNGNLVNSPDLRAELLSRGFGLTASSDTEVMTLMLAAAGGRTWEERLERTLPAWKGAYSLVVLTSDRVIAVRDPWGFRPLSVGRLPEGGWATASETSALLTLGCLDVSEIGAGEMVTLQGAEIVRHQTISPAAKQAHCTFEFVYFSRPDSVWDSRSVHEVRQRLGAELAKESPVEADVVVPVPDSSIPAAIGFSVTSGIPFNDGLIKNRYIGRTFIEPSQAMRDRGVAMKFNALRSNLEGKRVIVIDDSLVRGTTAGPLVKLIRDAGAAEVHLRITCPPITNACHFGVDMGHDGDLIAARLSVEEIRREIGADSLGFLSLDGMMRAVGRTEGYCNACFTGDYPIPVGAPQRKLAFEGAIT
jgi:amidophosphoribosyltransferase